MKNTKYIRTKDGIYEIDVLSIRYLGEAHFSCWDVKHTRIFNAWHVIKQANTIEELCDEFVIIFEDGTIILEPNLSTKEGKYIKYGAIWTEWGLKYVARMKGILPNGEIDWELL